MHKSIVNILIKSLFILIMVLSFRCTGNYTKHQGLQSNQDENDTKICLLDSLKIDSIYIKIDSEVCLGEFLLKKDKIYVHREDRNIREEVISQRENDSIIKPMAALFIDNAEPIRLGKRKIKDFWYDEFSTIIMKIYTTDSIIERNEEYIEFIGDEEIIYSQDYMKIVDYVFARMHECFILGDINDSPISRVDYREIIKESRK